MRRAPSAQPGQMNLDLFASTTLTPADVAPAAFVRIPMKEPPTGPSDGTFYPPPQISRPPGPPQPTAVPFRLTGDRGLAQGWKRRALDNIEAIRIARKIEAEQRTATPEEQASLIRFCAFSSSELAQSVFRRAGTAFRAGWETIGATLEDLVSPAELAGLARATQYAHYTPEYLVRALWRAVTGFGFAGGRVLEPGCGTGLFIALEPEALRGRCHYTGIEADPITAKIAAASLSRQRDPRRGLHQGEARRSLRPRDRQPAVLRPHGARARIEWAAVAFAARRLHRPFAREPPARRNWCLRRQPLDDGQGRSDGTGVFPGAG